MVAGSPETNRHDRGERHAPISIDELLQDPEIVAALDFAAEMYLRSYRKLSGQDFFLHPYGAFERLAAVTSDKDVLIAVILHDVVELHPEVTFEMLAEMFGERAARLVACVTKDDSIVDREARNDAYLRNVADATDEGAILVAMVDKIDNLTDILDFVGGHGVKVLDRFKGTPAQQLQWYVSVLGIALNKGADSSLIDQLADAVAQFQIIVESLDSRQTPNLSDVA
jgi:(p)ppGpp synthase/HD superfamily hydrolase